MKDVLNLIVKNLVEKKEDVSISESIEKEITVFTVKVNTIDMGKVIGKDGKIANSIRIIMKSLASAEKKRVSVQFID